MDVNKENKYTLHLLSYNIISCLFCVDINKGNKLNKLILYGESDITHALYFLKIFISLLKKRRKGPLAGAIEGTFEG